MGTVPRRRRWLVVPAASALVLLTTASVAHGGDGATCRVVNLEQGTNGRSLVRMVERARDGDRLHVRGTCRGHVVVDVDVLIRGKGEGPTLEGPGRWRTAVRVTRGAKVTIRDLTVQHGRGVRNEGRLTLRHSIVRRSTTSGISNEGRMAIIGSVVRNNRGGGIYNLDNSTLELVGSTVSANASGYNGGGILNIGSVTTLRHSRIVNNRTSGWGGGIFNGEPGSSENGTLILIDTVVTGNVADGLGGGILNHNYSSITIDAASAVTGNSPDDCYPAESC